MAVSYWQWQCPTRVEFFDYCIDEKKMQECVMDTELSFIFRLPFPGFRKSFKTSAKFILRYENMSAQFSITSLLCYLT